MLRFLTAGESHGPAIVAILDGFPAGLKVDFDALAQEMSLRQQGYGRGARQKIEADSVNCIGGIRHGVTTGGPIALLIQNNDWDNWQHVMSSTPVDTSQSEVQEQFSKKAITRFRPGHADLAGTMKFHHEDVRDVLERSSARETAARVAAGALCQQLLNQCGITLAAHVLQVGDVIAKSTQTDDLRNFTNIVKASEMFCADPDASEAMKVLIKDKWTEGDSLGGKVEVLADGLPVGLGSYTQWDKKLDAQLACAIMSIQAIKAVEIGDGITSASLPGSQVHDALYPQSQGNGTLPFERKTNHAGGIEGGMTNGSRLVVKAYMKPLPTLRKGLPSLSFPDFKSDTAHYERSDVCAISACSIICKSMAAIVLAQALTDKFGGDSLADIQAALKEYRQVCRSPLPNSPRQTTSPAESIGEDE